MSYLHEAALFLADGPHLHVEKPFTLPASPRRSARV
jgi:hypothetical protein